MWSDISDIPATREELISQVRRIGKYRALRLITAINCVTLVRRHATSDVQVDLINNLTESLGVLRGQLMNEVGLGSTLFAAEPLLILVKFVVDYGVDTETETEAAATEAFVNAVLLVNDLFVQEQMRLQAGGTNIESFLPMELRSAALDQEPFDHLAARLYSFMKWVRAQDTTSKDFCDVDGAFTDSLGLSYEDICGAGLILRHYYRSIASERPLLDLDPIMDVNMLLEVMHEHTFLRRFLAAYSISLVDLAADLAGRDGMSVAALLPLQRKPLIRLSDSLYACPSLDFISASLGSGLFHRLAEHYQGSGRRSRFYHFFARFLQEYVEETIARTVKQTDATVVPEFEYYIGKRRFNSSDVIVVDGRRLIVFDVCNKRLNTELSLHAGDLGAMQADVDAMIVAQAKQLTGRIQDFKDGAYSIAGLTAADVDTIIPVAVTHQSIHGWSATRAYIDRRLAEEGYLQTGPRLEIISIAEIETLVGIFDGALSIADLLIQRSSHIDTSARDRNLKNYLLINGGWDGTEKSTSAEFQEWFDTAAARLRAWGAPM